MATTTEESALERQVRQEDQAHAATLAAMSDADDQVDGTASGNDPEKGQLFDVPRVKVHVDESDPTVLKISLSGGIELDRAIPADVDWFNKLAAGKDVDLEITAHVAGSKKTHRRDSEGNVDAIVETKSLIVHSVETA